MRPRTLRPIIDGVLVPEDEWIAHRAGRFVAFPLLIGSNLDEGTQLASQCEVASVAAHRDFLEQQFGAYASDAALHYEAQGVEDIPRAWSDLFGDTQFTYAAHALARSCARHAPVWRYLFTFREPGVVTGPFHGGETAFSFGTAAIDGSVTLRSGGPASDRLAREMSGLWSKFITTGDPGWQRCADNSAPYRVLDGGSGLGRGWRSDAMAFLDRYHERNAHCAAGLGSCRP
jgi:para-nitrobenzyl esterase